MKETQGHVALAPVRDEMNLFLARGKVRIFDQHMIGDVENMLAGAVVLGEQPFVAGEIAEILDARVAPTVDGLFFVADNRHRPRCAVGEQAQQPVLGDTGILKLVDQDMLEARGIAPANSFVARELLHDDANHIGEIEQEA